MIGLDLIFRWVGVVVVFWAGFGCGFCVWLLIFGGWYVDSWLGGWGLGGWVSVLAWVWCVW